jgi:hypothetical protein
MAIMANRTTSQLRLRWRAPIDAVASSGDVTAGKEIDGGHEGN